VDAHRETQRNYVLTLKLHRSNTATTFRAFQGTHRVHEAMPGMSGHSEVTGNGHHGQDFVGVASIRSGKGIKLPPTGAMNMMNVI
jgi:hypothetical protein